MLCVCCGRLVLDVAVHVGLTITDIFIVSVTVRSTFACSILYKKVPLSHPNLVSFCFPSAYQPSAMAEHLGIEFMGMEQSILTLSPSLAT